MMRGYGRGVLVAIVLMSCGIAWAQGPKAITVGATGADFTTVQAAVNAAPDEGAVIKIRPGVYREVVHVDKPKIQLRGDGGDWTKVVLVYGNSAASTCGTRSFSRTRRRSTRSPSGSPVPRSYKRAPGRPRTISWPVVGWRR